MKKIFVLPITVLAVMTAVGCNSGKESALEHEKNVALPHVTLVKYCADYNDYPKIVSDNSKQVHSIIVYTDDGKIFSAEFEGKGYQDDPAWISPGSDDCYERLTELAEGELSGSVPEEEQALIRDNYENFSEWMALKMADCGTIYDYMDVTELYVVFEDGGETRVEKLAELSCSPNCRDSAAVRKFAGAILGSPFPSDD